MKRIMVKTARGGTFRLVEDNWGSAVDETFRRWINEKGAWRCIEVSCDSCPQKPAEAVNWYGNCTAGAFKETPLTAIFNKITGNSPRPWMPKR